MAAVVMIRAPKPEAPASWKTLYKFRESWTIQIKKYTNYLIHNKSKRFLRFLHNFEKKLIIFFKTTTGL